MCYSLGPQNKAKQSKAKQSKAKQSKENVQGPLQHLHSSLGPMGRVPRYRVCGRDLCCFGFVQALSGGRRPFAFRYRGPYVGRRDVALDNHVAPV